MKYDFDGLTSAMERIMIDEDFEDEEKFKPINGFLIRAKQTFRACHYNEY